MSEKEKINNHLKLSDMTEICDKVQNWLNDRYGEEQGKEIWKKVCAQYDEYMKDFPDYGGKKNAHALAIYGAVIVFSLYPLLPDNPPVEQLQEMVAGLFMAGFVKLGKIFDLNRKADIRLINFVFTKVGNKDRKQIKQYPDTFCNVAEPFDKENRAARYSFTQCPNAEFAKKHNLLHVLPLFCNSDYRGISLIHGMLIRKGTCGNSDRCDYCVVGSESPLAKKYEIVKDDKGFLVSREKKNNE